MDNKTKIIIGLIIAIVLLLLFNRTEVTPPPPNPKIEQIKDSVNTLVKQDSAIANQSDSIRIVTDTLYVTLERVKTIRDTIRIIKVQDSIIVTQNEQITTLHSRVELKDLVIQQKDSLCIEELQQKDLHILTLEKAIKQEKRKRILTIIVSAGVVIAIVVASV